MKTVNVKFFLPNCFILFIISFIIGCQNTSMSGILITRGVIVNHCPNEITDIKIVHLPTKAVASFSGIFTGKTAEIGFQKRELLAVQAIVIWKEDGALYQKKLQLPQDHQSKSSTPQRLVYSIFTKGNVKAELVSDL